VSAKKKEGVHLGQRQMSEARRTYETTFFKGDRSETERSVVLCVEKGEAPYSDSSVIERPTNETVPRPSGENSKAVIERDAMWPEKRKGKENHRGKKTESKNARRTLP